MGRRCERLLLACLLVAGCGSDETGERGFSPDAGSGGGSGSSAGGNGGIAAGNGGAHAGAGGASGGAGGAGGSSGTTSASGGAPASAGSDAGGAAQSGGATGTGGSMGTGGVNTSVRCTKNQDCDPGFACYTGLTMPPASGYCARRLSSPCDPTSGGGCPCLDIAIKNDHGCEGILGGYCTGSDDPAGGWYCKGL